MNQNLFSHFQHAQPADPAAPLLLTPAGNHTPYGQMEAITARLAGRLARLGLAPGDRVTVQVAKSPSALWLYLACLRAGLVFHPLNDGYRPGELRYLVDDAAPGLLICAPDHEPLFAELAPRGTRVLTLAADASGSLLAGIDDEPADFPPATRADDDIAVLLYTSGTTGKPKGAMITHGNLASNARALVQTWGFTSADRLLHALPLYHAHGLFVGVGCVLMSGASLLLLPRFDAGEVERLLPRCTVYMGVPTHYSRLLQSERFDRRTCAGVRLFVSGSAPLSPEVFAAFRARTGQAILERYGMTETGMNTSNPLDGERRAGSVGPPLPGVELRITGERGEPLPRGATGEIELRGPNVFAGYWRAPEKTAQAFTADGFFRSGDLGSLDGDGYLTISGRAKDLVISGGLNVYPREVEIALDTLPDVAESAVIGVPHPDFGEAVVAVVVAAPGAAPTEAGIIAALRERLAGYKVPKQIFFADELPRNTMGKVEKTVLRARYSETFSGIRKPS